MPDFKTIGDFRRLIRPSMLGLMRHRELGFLALSGPTMGSSTYQISQIQTLKPVERDGQCTNTSDEPVILGH